MVAGAVLASRGSLAVATRGRVLRLTPRDDGGTDHEVIGTAPDRGTRVEVRLGKPFAIDRSDLALAGCAVELAERGGPSYRGKTSPHWYDPDGFWELCQADPGRTARELLAEFFDGCSEPAAGRIASVVPRGRLARDLTRAEAGRLLAEAKRRARRVRPRRLGCLGREALPFLGYAKGEAEWTTASGVRAPVVVEVWADPTESDDDAYYDVRVNRTPVAAVTHAWIEKEGHSRALVLHGCSAHMEVKVGRRPVGVTVNIDTPFMPITTDGKTPDLGRLRDMIAPLAEKAVAGVRRWVREPASERPSQKALILAAIPAGAEKMSGGSHRFSQRQLFYAVREVVKRLMPDGPDGEPFELDWGYFCSVITDHETERGDVPLMYRDPRGTLYHPHTREEIPLGTIAVENYDPPRWTFNKILYCEKEGFTEIMKSVGWPERHDCALVSSKGYASRAVRDVFDLLGETGQDITFYCVHDADAYGTMIYQSLQEATRARGARKVRVVNLGLEPAEALAMGLEAEPVAGGGKKPVAEYVEPEWREWLQTNRVELNAMTTPQFIAWLDAKLAPYDSKVIPPPDVMADRLAGCVRENLRRAITERVLAEAGIEKLVEQASAGLSGDVVAAAGTLSGDVAAALDERPYDSWTAPVERIAGRIAAGGSDAVRDG